MPLSEQEQRLLEEMERSLYHNDADFVATVGNRRGRPNYRTVLLGVLLAVVGVAAVVTGVVLRQPFIGIAGFVVMFVGVLVAVSSPKRGSVADDEEPPMAGSARRQGFMDRMNERWEKRQDEHDQ